MLFRPWRDESLMHENYETAKECFDANINEINKTDFKYYEKMFKAIEETVMNMKIKEQQEGFKLTGINIAPTTVAQQFRDAQRTEISENPFEAMTADVTEIKAAEKHFDQTLQRCSNDTDMPDPDDDFLTSLTLNTMTEEQYYEMRGKLNETQKYIVGLFDDFYEAKERNENPEPIRLQILGGAGVGKSFLIGYITEHLIRKIKKRVVLLTAYTGAASKLIGGQTLHSAVKLSRETNIRCAGKKTIGPQMRDKLNKQYSDLELLVIDEISLVSHPQLKETHNNLNEILGKSNDKTAWFGNLNVILLGDFHQIRPVGARMLCLYDDGENLLDRFQPVFLTENMRQKNDLPFTELLNRMRLGIKNKDDIETLKTRLNIDLTKPPWPEALRLYPTINQCDVFNHDKVAE